MDTVSLGPMDDLNFLDIFGNICDSLSKTEKTSVLNKFHHAKSDRERMTIVTPLVKDFCPSVKDQKCENRARVLREEGNKCFGKKAWSEALVLYSQSIAVCPPAENCDALSMAYANRSATLKPLGYFEECLLDIERALDLDYPDHLRYKLYTRQGQCLRDMGQTEKAMDSLHMAVQSIDHSDLPRDKKIVMKVIIQKELDMCRKDAKIKHSRSAQTQVPYGEPPTISYEQNAELTSASDCIALHYNEDMGRHFVATKDILPGDVLIVERPYATLLKQSLAWNHCGHCLARCHALLPCPGCAWMMFCSHACQEAAWTYHEFECQLMPSVLRLKCGHLPLITRIISVAGVNYLTEFLTNATSPDAHPEDQRTKGFDSNGQYVSSDFNSIYNLSTNEDLRPPQNQVQRYVMAACLVKCLRLNSIKETYLSLFGCLILRLIYSVNLNAHSISEYYMIGPLLDFLTHQSIGMTLNATLSLTNHSCNPSVVRCNHGTTTALVAVRPIAKGMQVMDSYGPDFLDKPKDMRQLELKSNFFFNCNCDACVNDWPIRKDLPMMSIDPDSHEEKEVIYLKQCMRDVKPYTKVPTNLEVTPKSLQLFIGLLIALDAMGKRVTKDYVVCQKAIQKYYSQTGNTIYTSSE